jgi:hypothetical protein
MALVAGLLGAPDETAADEVDGEVDEDDRRLAMRLMRLGLAWLAKDE